MEKKDPFDLVAALREQVEANAERLRRNREMVDVINQHLDSSAPMRQRRGKKP